MGCAGFDLVVIDQQHGTGGSAELLAQLTAARAAGLPALVRVAANEQGLVGRALDAGAQGIVCPMIEGADAAARFVAEVKYPPLGSRSWGAYRASPVAEFAYAPDTANDWTIACAQIETTGAITGLDAILALPGIDMVLVGPNDLAISMIGRPDIRATAVTEALDRIHECCRAQKVIAGIFANDIDYARPLIAKGWDVIAVGADIGWLARSAHEIVREFRA